MLDQAAFTAIAEASRSAAQAASAEAAGNHFGGTTADPDQVMFACISGLATAAGNGLAALATRKPEYGSVQIIEGVCSQLVSAFREGMLMRRRSND